MKNIENKFIYAIRMRSCVKYLHRQYETRINHIENVKQIKLK